MVACGGPAAGSAAGRAALPGALGGAVRYGTLRAGARHRSGELRALPLGGDPLCEVGDERGRRHAAVDRPVQRGCGRRGHVDGVHPPIHGGPGRAPTGLAPPGQRLLLGLVHRVAGALAHRTTGPPPLRVVPLAGDALVLAVALVVLVRGDDPEPDAEPAQPLRDRVDRGRGDHEQAEDREQHQHGHGQGRAHGEDQRLGGAPADEPARVLHRGGALVPAGRPAGDVDQAQDADDEGRQPDADAAVGIGLLGMADETDRHDAEQDRDEQIQPPEETGDQHRDQIPDGTAQVRPGTGGDDQREGEQQQGHAVLAVSGVEVLGPLADPAEDGADRVRAAEPERAHQPHHAPGRGRRGLGHGLLGRGALGGRGLLRRGPARRRGLLRRRRRTAGAALRGARRALGTLTGRT